MAKSLYHIIKETNASDRRRIIETMLFNSFIWLIPGLILLSVSLVIILIFVLAEVADGDIDLYKRMPKGLVSFFGIAYFLVGLALIIGVFFIPELEVQGIIYAITAAVICWLLAYVGIKKEWRRLAKLR